MITSAIYTGTVRHRRFTPVLHAFRYRMCLLLLDVERIPALFRGSLLWSATRVAPGRFRRADFLGDPLRPLADCVRDLVREQTGRSPAGPVMLLANLRYFGVLMNPISCYFCYEADAETLAAVVAEVTNTPWNERHAYVLPAGEGRVLEAQFRKDLHVSPFNPMDMQYHWKSSSPDQRVAVHLETHRDGSKVMDATLSLRREPLNRGSLARLLLLRFPLMSLRIAGAIYWEALRLLLKRAPVYLHPHTGNTLKESTE